jgi:hypothetical protein
LFLTPADWIAPVTAGAIQFPPTIEANYAARMLEWLRQTYDGLLNCGCATTTCEDLTGGIPLTLRRWVEKNRETELAVGGRPPPVPPLLEPESLLTGSSPSTAASMMLQVETISATN